LVKEGLALVASVLGLPQTSEKQIKLTSTI